uniref:Transmembrane protein n=1 Tax=Tetraselmis sp. GSL018 TaxID=582737 RepID=A0A061R1K9_9CHLO
MESQPTMSREELPQADHAIYIPEATNVTEKEAETGSNVQSEPLMPLQWVIFAIGCGSCSPLVCLSGASLALCERRFIRGREARGWAVNLIVGLVALIICIFLVSNMASSFSAVFDRLFYTVLPASAVLSSG